jgi:hypothetical protein
MCTGIEHLPRGDQRDMARLYEELGEGRKVEVRRARNTGNRVVVLTGPEGRKTPLCIRDAMERIEKALTRHRGWPWMREYDAAQAAARR